MKITISGATIRIRLRGAPARLASPVFLGSLLAVLPPANPTSAMAQTDQTAASRWLAKAPLARPFEVPATRRGWDKQRQEIRQELLALLGTFPARPKTPQVWTLAREARDGYVLERFQFDNGLGASVPGYLLLPSGSTGKSPGVLYCHWHGGQYDIGKEELFRTNALPVAGGPALARRGYAVLAIDACCFGERDGQGPGGVAEKGGAGEMSASKFNLWLGRTLWGSMLRDDLMALDYLCSRPEVDAQRIGVTGISMGATRTWWIMALDERPKTGVAVGCLTRYQNLIQAEGLRYHGIYYFVPGLLARFDSEAIIALAAPRPMLFQTGDQDSGSPVEGVRQIETAVRKVYRLYGAEMNLENLIYPGLGHVYTPEMWARTTEWLDEKLKGPPK